MHYNIKLKYELKKKGFTQKSLAAAIEEPQAVISQLINERYAFPEKRLTELRRKIAKVLKVPQRKIF